MILSNPLHNQSKIKRSKNQGDISNDISPLGSQLKVMHNLRLTCSDLLDLCRRRSPEEALQTSMSLFSSNLQGSVLLVDNRVSSYKGTKKGEISVRFARMVIVSPICPTRSSTKRILTSLSPSRIRGNMQSSQRVALPGHRDPTSGYQDAVPESLCRASTVIAARNSEPFGRRRTP